MLWIVTSIVAQAAGADQAWQIAERIAAGGGLFGYIFGAVFLADRLGLLKRKNGNGNGHGEHALLQELVASTKQIAATLERLTERADSAHDLLVWLQANQGGELPQRSPR